MSPAWTASCPAFTTAGVSAWLLGFAVYQLAAPIGATLPSLAAAMLAFGDALAIACLDARGFGHEDFARSHPAGALGRKLLTRVSDVMRSGDAIPRVTSTATVMDALHEITRKQLGMTAVLDASGKLTGIFTDGDRGRRLERVGDVRPLAVAEVMTRTPLTIAPDALAVEAAQLMDRHRKNQLLVIDQGGQLVGALNNLDLMNAKVI